MKKLVGYKKGVNLGGWLSQCCHEKAHYDTFITENDMKEISTWDVDHVRLPIDYNLIEQEDGTRIEENFQYIDTCIDWCEKYHLNLILDLHKTAGYVFDDLEYSNGFFQNEALQDRFIALWEELARRYAKYAKRMAFELLNEIVDPGVAKEWNALSRRAALKIREYSKDVRILIGGINYNSVLSVQLLDPPLDENIVYNFHCYDPQLFTHQSAYWQEYMPKNFHIDYPLPISEYIRVTEEEHFPENAKELYQTPGLTAFGRSFFDTIFASAVEYAKKNDVPLYCGEYGVIDQAPVEGTLNWYRDIHEAFEAHDIGRAAWTYKKMDFGITQEHVKDIKAELIQLL